MVKVQGSTYVAQKTILLYNSLMEQPFAERTNEKMKEVMMNPEANGPAIHYYMIRGGKEKLNITVMETGTIGGIIYRAYGHYHVFDFKETYKIIHSEDWFSCKSEKRMRTAIL